MKKPLAHADVAKVFIDLGDLSEEDAHLGHGQTN